MKKKSDRKISIHFLKVGADGLAHQTRLLKSARVQVQSNAVDDVLVYGPWCASGKLVKKVEKNIFIAAVGYQPTAYFGLDFVRKIICAKALFLLKLKSVYFFWKNKRRIEQVNCHHLQDLPFCYLLSKISKSKLIYDSHELDLESRALIGKPIKKYYRALWLDYLAPKLDLIIVVSPGMIDWYKSRYGNSIDKIIYARNIPDNVVYDGSEIVPLKKQLGLKTGDILFIYIGYFLTHRNIELLLNIFSMLKDKSKHIVFLGKGNLEEMIAQQQTRNSNIHLVPAVASNQIMEKIRDVDVGFSVLETNMCLNHDCSLSNKLFQCLQSTVPVIVTPNKDQKHLVESMGAGWVVNNESDLRKLVNEVTLEDIDDKKANISTNKIKISWEKEARVMGNAYKELSEDSSREV